MNLISLTDYMEQRAAQAPGEFFKFKKTNEKLYLNGGCNCPDVSSGVIVVDGIKVTVLYYCLVTIGKEQDIFDYHFVILFPEGHYERGNYIYDFETSFEDYITQYVECKVLNFYYHPTPIFKEAVIYGYKI